MNPVHQARKRFGQNFLTDKVIIDKIVSCVNPMVEDNLIEIGPGKGALTDLLISQCPKMQAVGSPPLPAAAGSSGPLRVRCARG